MERFISAVNSQLFSGFSGVAWLKYPNKCPYFTRRGFEKCDYKIMIKLEDDSFLKNGGSQRVKN